MWKWSTLDSNVAQSWPNPTSNSSVAERREYGSGGISWLGPRRVRLRIWVPSEGGGRRRATKVVRVADKDHGGLGQAKAELKVFVEASTTVVDSAPAVVEKTFAEMLTAYIAQCKRVGRTQSTIESFTYCN